jgi:putative transposase
MTVKQKRSLVEPRNKQINISRQCELLGVSKAAYYYQPQPISQYNLKLMRIIDELFLEDPTIGVELMTSLLARKNEVVNIKRVRRLMRAAGLMAVYPKPRLTLQNKAHRKFPYLLNKLDIVRPNQVWGTDITYVPLRGGFGYVVAIMDLYSRYIIDWEFSLSIDADFCVRTLERALQVAHPEIFHSDQGVQYTCEDFQNKIPKDVKVSMSGRGRAFDNILVERLWRSYKYEEVYLHDYQTPLEARRGAEKYFTRYNNRRPHRTLKYSTPAEVYFSGSILSTG